MARISITKVDVPDSVLVDTEYVSSISIKNEFQLPLIYRYKWTITYADGTNKIVNSIPRIIKRGEEKVIALKASGKMDGVEHHVFSVISLFREQDRAEWDVDVVSEAVDAEIIGTEFMGV